MGTFKNQDSTIKIKDSGGGKFDGEVVVTGHTLTFSAEAKGSALVGTFKLEDENMEFRITVKGSKLTLAMEDETTVFTRQDESPGASDKSNGAPADRKDTSTPHNPGDQKAVLKINGTVIDDSTLQKFETEYRLKMPRGDFWYDKVSGGWGITGGPTLGFTAPGINLGGPLRTDASRGNTGVFINQRELPLQDVVGLQQLNVPVQRGRWWVDSRGNFGVEGSPVTLGNIFQFSANRGGAYQRATAGGYIGGDGQTSYFFDPKSGSSVMVGH
ncbi:MAG: hypothetical protein U1G07_00690 [Verrucomicrobiota bacterium]